MSEFLEQAIKAQAERIRNLERENRELKAKLAELERMDNDSRRSKGNHSKDQKPNAKERPNEVH